MLERLIKDQYDSNDKGSKSNKDIKPTSMQTPYDTDATFRYKYKNNVGYVGNIEETIAIDENLKTKNTIISNWNVTPNVIGDKEFMEKTIALNEEKVMIVDSSYYSDELDNLAKNNNIKIHPIELVGKKIKDSMLSKFNITKDIVLECPNHNKPISSIYKKEKDIIRAKFCVEKCKKCPVEITGKSSTLNTSPKTYKRHKMIEKRNDKNYIKISNLRAGIEGIPSVLRRRYNIDNRAGKGLLRLKIKFGCAIIAINTKRASKLAKNYA